MVKNNNKRNLVVSKYIVCFTYIICLLFVILHSIEILVVSHTISSSLLFLLTQVCQKVWNYIFS